MSYKEHTYIITIPMNNNNDPCNISINNSIMIIIIIIIIIIVTVYFSHFPDSLTKPKNNNSLQ